MKILLCLSKTPDTTAKIRFTGDGKELDTSNMQFVINPNDDHALAHAVELKNKNNGEITIVHVGDSSSDSVIRKGLAIGADKAIRIDAHPNDALFVARQIAEIYKNGEYDFIMTGCESIDYNGAQVSSLLGELLQIPAFNYVTAFAPDGTSSAEISRDIDGGEENIKSPLPAVIGATKELAEEKIPNMRGIMMAKKKPLEVQEPAEASKTTETIKFEPPKEKGDCQYIDPENAEELIEKLQKEAKVL